MTAGTPSPTFSAPALAPGGRLTTADLKGHPSVLVFISSDDGEQSLINSELRSATRALWMKFHGHMYFVYSGNETDGRDFVLNNIKGFPENRVIIDELGFISRRFRISRSLEAVELDAEARVQRYGRPDPAITEKGEGDYSEVPFDSQPGNRRKWPDGRAISGAGFARVDSSVSCILTRFHLRSILSLVSFYLAFRRVRRDAKSVDGLMKAIFLVEDLHTCYTLSLWKDDWSIVEFGSTVSHVRAANSAFDHTYDKRTARSNIWSSQFRLWAVSCHNLDWDEVDLKTALGSQWLRREEMADAVGGREEKHVY